MTWSVDVQTVGSFMITIEEKVILNQFRGKGDSFCYVRLSSWNKEYGYGTKAVLSCPRPINCYAVRALHLGQAKQGNGNRNSILFRILVFGNDLTMYQPVSWVLNYVFFDLST